MPDDQYDKALRDALEANERRGDTAAAEKAARAAQEALRRQKPRFS